MRKYIFTFLLLIISYAQAQTYRFFYEVDFKKDSLSKERLKELMVLDINKEETKFYAHRLLRADSLMNLDNIGILIASGEVEVHPNFKDKLKRKTGSSENISYYSPQVFSYYSVKTNDVQNWKILPDKKEIKGFKVQKATTNFGGRSWEAWFCEEIPFFEGPHKFRGLPGLILELKDTKDNYIFSFVGNKNLDHNVDTKFFLETDFGKRNPIEINEKKWQQLQMDYYQNPIKDFGNRKMYEIIDGQQKEVDKRELIKEAQNRIRKNNNPIELDKAVKYPAK